MYGDEALTGNWATAPSYNNVTTGTGTSVVSVLTGAGQNRCYLPIDNVQQGKSYITTITVDPASTASFGYYVRDGVNPNSGDLLISQTVVSGETYTLFCTATSNDMNVLLVGGSNSTMSASISVKEVTSTAGGTPLLRTADTNEPRLEYDASGQPLGLLIEEQRSNILHQSEDFQNAYWGKVGIATSPSGSVTPDGLGNATLLFAIGTSGAYVARSNLGSAGQGYTASVFAKAGTHDIIRISNQSSGTSGGWFDLTNGTTLTENGANNKSFIQYVGNGWYKCSRYFDSWVNTNNSLLFGVSASDGSTQSAVGDTVSLWGAQLELGAFPTSYIPTSGSTVTRNQDVCRIEKEKYHLHQKKGTIYCEFDAITSTVETNLEYQRIYELATTDSDDRVTAWIKNDDGTLTSQVYDNNVSQAGYPLEVGYNDKVNTIKVATAYGVNHFQASNDGKVGGIDSSVTLDYPRYRLAIMQRTTTGSPLCGHMKRITYTPKVLTGAQLIELTKPSSSPTMSLTFDGQATSELVEGLHD